MQARLEPPGRPRRAHRQLHASPARPWRTVHRRLRRRVRLRERGSQEEPARPSRGQRLCPCLGRGVRGARRVPAAHAAGESCASRPTYADPGTRRWVHHPQTATRNPYPPPIGRVDSRPAFSRAHGATLLATDLFQIFAAAIANSQPKTCARYEPPPRSPNWRRQSEKHTKYASPRPTPGLCNGAAPTTLKPGSDPS